MNYSEKFTHLSSGVIFTMFSVSNSASLYSIFATLVLENIFWNISSALKKIRLGLILGFLLSFVLGFRLGLGLELEQGLEFAL